MPLESKFQSELIKDIRDLFPGCVILKNDANYLQGFPDLIILYGTCAVLESKRDKNSRHRPNQDYYIEHLREMGIYANFVEPENKEQVLYDLQQAFRHSRSSRVSEPFKVPLGQLRRRKD